MGVIIETNTDVRIPCDSVEEYLAYDLAHEGKHEYWHGEIVAMAGAMDTHNLVVVNLSYVTYPQIRARGCLSYVSDQRVLLPEGNFCYPDFVMACDPRFTDERPNSLINPLLIGEVLSPSTAHIDRGDKLDSYLEIESLQAYWLFEPEQAAVTMYERADAGWHYRTLRGMDAEIATDLFESPISLRSVYLDVLGDDEVAAA